MKDQAGGIFIPRRTEPGMNSRMDHANILKSSAHRYGVKAEVLTDGHDVISDFYTLEAGSIHLPENARIQHSEPVARALLRLEA